MLSKKTLALLDEYRVLCDKLDQAVLDDTNGYFSTCLCGDLTLYAEQQLGVRGGFDDLIREADKHYADNIDWLPIRWTVTHMYPDGTLRCVANIRGVTTSVIVAQDSAGEWRRYVSASFVEQFKEVGSIDE